MNEWLLFVAAFLALAALANSRTARLVEFVILYYRLDPEQRRYLVRWLRARKAMSHWS